MTTTTTTTTVLQELQISKAKIMELQSALFFTESTSIVKLPTHVISGVEVDDENQIWFVVPRPTMHIDAFDKEMPAKLDFSKKGLEFYVNVRGTAVIMADPAETDKCEGLSKEMKERMRDGNLMGIKVIIQEAAVVDNTPKPKQNWFQASRSQLSSWFF